MGFPVISDSERPIFHPKPGHVATHLRRMRQDFGVGNETEALRLALIAMLAGYDKAMETLPEGSLARKLVEGAFGRAPHLARGLI